VPKTAELIVFDIYSDTGGRRRVHIKRGSEISSQMPRLYFQMLFMIP